MRLRTRLAVLVCKASGAVLRKARPRRHQPAGQARAQDRQEHSRRAGARRQGHGRDRHERQDHHLPHDRAGVCRRRAQVFLQQVGREPADRHHRRVRAAFYPVGPLPLHPRAHRVRRGGIPPDERIPAGRVPCREQHLPRPARPLRRDHPHPERHPRGHHPRSRTRRSV